MSLWCLATARRRAMVRPADLLFPAEAARKARGQCPGCGVEVDAGGLKDELSRREFRISGLCQACQDSFFDAREDGLEEVFA